LAVQCYGGGDLQAGYFVEEVLDEQELVRLEELNEVFGVENARVLFGDFSLCDILGSESGLDFLQVLLEDENLIGLEAELGVFLEQLVAVLA